ncbi:FAD-dependent oxidoreductase [Bacillus sp. SJS]|uniref:FAD-dependent oxidoreductase n=1 Tax=Bacillus sp. SJS TaxID=1423321 RepID=UPI0004DD289B|nr:FAD-dependent oxidoreductase [Bacillus sp. SJS]KZZ83590.1 (2Fe-2S)-binding protein [Bacillus sp. SJS]
MTNSRLNTKLPLYPSSLWRPVENEPSFPPLEESLTVDTVIVGAGITGITAAYLLQKAGIHTALIDARKALGGTTGHTTAKITCQHGEIYDSLIQGIGEEKAREYFQANETALSFIKDTVQKLEISCQLQTQDAYLYAASSSGDKKVRAEYEAYKKLGIPAEFIENTPLPFPVKSAIRVKNQAQFHPVEYLSDLLKEFVSSGGYVFEHTRAVELEKSENPVITTAEGYKLTSQHVLISSHYPFPDITGLQFTKLEPERSYILAAKTSHPFPKGMYISADDPVRSLRSAEEDGEQLVLIGGEDHKTGQILNTEQCYEALAEFGEEQLDMTEIRYRWSAQDLKTLDGVPYAGPITKEHPNILITTGYGLWGMTNGTAAAQIAADSIMGKKNPYAELYSPQRPGNKTAAVQFIKQNTDTAKEFVKGKLKRSQEKAEDLGFDEGARIKVNGHKAGAYKDPAGNISLVKPVCTHMGCDLEWNNGDRSWDCPCHGSRFSTDGEILEGPAVKPLTKLD